MVNLESAPSNPSERAKSATFWDSDARAGRGTAQVSRVCVETKEEQEPVGLPCHANIKFNRFVLKEKQINMPNDLLPFEV